MGRRILAQLRGLWRGEAIHGEIAEEREFHIAMRAAELARSGRGEAEAREAARQRFGRAMRLQEQGFDARGGGALTDLAGDARLALRLLRKTPVKTAALVATVAIGIGVNTAVFSVVKAVVLEPLPFARAGELMAIHQVSKGTSEGVSYPNFADWRTASRSFTGMAVYAADSATLSGRAGTVRLAGAVVSARLFRLLGVTPLRGRLFDEAEDEPGAGRTALISEGLWRAEFQGREDALGQALVLDGAAYRVVGVMRAALAFPVRSEPVDYWITVAADAEPSAWGGSIRNSRGYPRYDAAVGRLRPGVTAARAQAEMSAIAARVAREHPGVNLREGVRVSPAIEDVVGKVRPLLWILYGAVFCVLAAGCANAATLLIVGAVARGREFALRAALGAGPGRLGRQLVVESLAPALAGGAGGAALAWGLVGLFMKIAPPETPRLATVHADGAMLLYALGLSASAGLIFGALPAAGARRQNLAGMLKAGARRRGPRALRPGTLLIGAQVALSMALGCSAAVLTGSFWRIVHVPRGFSPEGVLTARVGLPPAAYPPGSEKTVRFYEELLATMRRARGVEAAGAAQSLPLSGQNNSTQVEAAAREGQEKTSADLRFVDAEYFRTLRIPLLEGRYPESEDRRGRPEIVVVNRAFAERFLQGRGALGAVLRLGWGGEGPKTVVGVVGDVRHGALSAQAAPEVYVPMAQFPLNDMAVVLRIAGPAAETSKALRAAVRQMDESVTVENVRTLEEHLLLSVAPQRLLMWVLGAFAAGTLLVAAIGLYGAMSYSTVCRRQEFGVRMALGAGTGGVMRLVLREGLSVAAGGVAAGLLLAVAGARFLKAWLYQTSPLDARSLACAGAILMAAAVAACWAPARRATRVNPAVSLRGE